jgi:hypothetical protein
MAPETGEDRLPAGALLLDRVGGLGVEGNSDLDAARGLDDSTRAVRSPKAYSMRRGGSTSV